MANEDKTFAIVFYSSINDMLD